MFSYTYILLCTYNARVTRTIRKAQIDDVMTMIKQTSLQYGQRRFPADPPVDKSFNFGVVCIPFTPLTPGDKLVEVVFISVDVGGFSLVELGMLVVSSSDD